MSQRLRTLGIMAALCIVASTALAHGVTGTARDQTGGVLPGVTVEAHVTGSATRETMTDAAGVYRLEVPAGRYELVFSLVAGNHDYARSRHGRASRSSYAAGPRERS